EEHVKNHNDKSSVYFHGTIPNPTTILCMPDGTEVARKTGVMTGKEFTDMIKETATKVGPGVSQDEYAFIKGKFKAGDDARAASKVKDAVEAYNAVIKAFGKNPNAKGMVETTQKKLEELNQAGMDILAKAKEDAAAGKVDEAKKAMKDVYANYKGLECAKAAEKEMAALAKDK
ncbi:MAG: hypothetical protein K8T20_14965, partial [Planctomycetes bacterium]|nr:hypothetical protein [Planctomycetota bacterium]